MAVRVAWPDHAAVREVALPGPQQGARADRAGLGTADRTKGRLAAAPESRASVVGRTPARAAARVDRRGVLEADRAPAAPDRQRARAAGRESTAGSGPVVPARPLSTCGPRTSHRRTSVACSRLRPTTP